LETQGDLLSIVVNFNYLKRKIISKIPVPPIHRWKMGKKLLSPKLALNLKSNQTFKISLPNLIQKFEKRKLI